MTMLANDICRCHNDKCEEREQCLRWVERNESRRETARISHSKFIPSVVGCKHRIWVKIKERKP